MMYGLAEVWLMAIGWAGMEDGIVEGWKGGGFVAGSIRHLVLRQANHGPVVLFLEPRLTREHGPAGVL